VKKFDIEPWLASHSVRCQNSGDELVFEHINGESSVLLPRTHWRDGILPIGTEPLTSFYQSYFGASLGNSHLTFATNIAGGVDISHGFRLHDFDQMAAQARELGIQIPVGEVAFLAEAAWMFIYTISASDSKMVLKKYDRDFGTARTIEGLDEVLESWWGILIADQLS